MISLEDIEVVRVLEEAEWPEVAARIPGWHPTAYANGRIPASFLAPIPGSGPYGGPKLRKDAARAYNALHRESMRRYGISMALHEGDVGQSYRNYDRQVLAKRVYGSNAATPGTSNHGLGINVDLETRQQRWVIDRIGAKYGFSKAWSDASWEWWHITFRADKVTADVTPFVVLKLGSKGKRVKTVQARLIGHGFGRVGDRRVPRKGEPGRGYYGKATRAAVKAFQRRRGLVADGKVGPVTWRALAKD